MVLWPRTAPQPRVRRLDVLPVSGTLTENGGEKALFRPLFPCCGCEGRADSVSSPWEWQTLISGPVPVRAPREVPEAVSEAALPRTCRGCEALGGGRVPRLLHQADS